MNIERLNQGKPIIAPRGDGWEKRGTSNSGALYLPRTEALMAMLSNAMGQDVSKDDAFDKGVVICIYSANGTTETDPVSRQRRGLALLDPSLNVRYRRDMYILEPDTKEGSVDLLGIEDARLTCHDGVFYLWYCGYNGKAGLACCASSRDLLHWEKELPLPGDINNTGNKDHVVFPEMINGKWWLLHRPWGEYVPNADDYVIRLASAPTLEGPWTDEGELLRGDKQASHHLSWVGGGAPPLPLGNGRFFELYHTGCFFHDGYRQYDAGACIIDFSKYEKGNVGAMVTERREPFMVPSTPEEKNADLRIDIIFPMSAHLHEGYLYFLYGAGDKATCGARVKWDEVLAFMA